MNRVRLERRAGAGDPIHVWPAHSEAAPSEFVWRGHRYRVRTLEPAASPVRGAGTASRRFHVRTTSGLACVLSHDGSRWRLDRLIPSGGGR